MWAHSLHNKYCETTKLSLIEQNWYFICALNYASVSFDICETNGFWTKTASITDPPLRYMYIVVHTQRHKAKNSICRRLDNRLNIYIWNVGRKHQSHGGLIQNFCVNKFGVLPLCCPCGTIASHFVPQKTVIWCFEIIISPSQRTSLCGKWVISPIDANMSCCLTRCSSWRSYSEFLRK
jgi:hypothetical protein